MKYTKFLSITIFLMCISGIHANTHVVTVSGMSFTPDTTNAVVGDTVRWVWVSRIHTTTSVTVPTGAATWNQPMDSAHTSFSYVVTMAGTYNYQCNYHYLMGMTGLIIANPNAIEPVSNTIPQKFNLHQNYPNPFNPSTTILFDVAERIPVDMGIYDITGSKVAVLVNETLNAGTYKITWDASMNPSGVYFMRFIAGLFSDTKKIVLIK